MSADNYYVVRRHPEGGYVVTQGFASDDRNNNDSGELFIDLEIEDYYPRFTSLAEARSEATSMYSEYGGYVHPECEAPPK